jgi:hypothetical protein
VRYTGSGHDVLRYPLAQLFLDASLRAPYSYLA